MLRVAQYVWAFLKKMLGVRRPYEEVAHLMDKAKATGLNIKHRTLEITHPDKEASKEIVE